MEDHQIKLTGGSSIGICGDQHRVVEVAAGYGTDSQDAEKSC